MSDGYLYLGDVLIGKSYTMRRSYLTYKAKTAGVIGLPIGQHTSNQANMYYRLNGDSWVQYEANSVTSVSSVTVSVGDVVEIKGNAERTNGYITFSVADTAKYDLSGNIMSLVYGDDDFSEMTGLPTKAYQPAFPFSGRYIVSAKDLVLPIENLANSQQGSSNGIYQAMFCGCTFMTEAPELPATTLTERCYFNMFSGCTSLETGPSVLPATALTRFCYSNMFSRCYNLKTGPVISATTLDTYCCQYMFAYCTSLTAAPDLRAITLTGSCYYGMFYSAATLSYINAQFTTTPGTNTTSWVYGVAPSGVFVKNPDAAWNVVGTNGVPTGWVVVTSTTNNIKIGVSGGQYVINSVGSDFDATNPSTNPVLLYYKGQIIADATWTANGGGYDINSNTMELLPGDLYLHITMSGGTPVSVSAISAEDSFFTLSIISAGTIYLGTNSSALQPVVQYRVNGGSWNTTAFSGVTINASVGDSIELKGTNSAYATNSNSYRAGFSGSTAYFEVCGNIMSLIDGDNFTGTSVTMGKYAFADFFRQTNVVSARNLILPNYTTICCYLEMFGWCYNLISSPALPSTGITTGCYSHLFYQCSKLKEAPALPATTLAQSCYYRMFCGCGSIISAPALPATTLTNNCYKQMFSNCTSLTTAPELSATTLASACCQNMFSGCTSLTTAPVLPATTLKTFCYSHMFYGCTSLTTAPELPATTLITRCYDAMFKGCTQLTTSPVLPATALTSYCYNQMFSGCTALNYVKALFTDMPGTSYTSNWLAGVASSGTFIKNPNASWSSSITRGVSTVPDNWTITT